MTKPLTRDDNAPAAPRWINILVQRQLEDISSGNGAYLDTFLKAAKAAGLNVRVIFAPWHSFGNRPWARIHPRLGEKIDEIVWPGAVLSADGRYVSLAPRVWVRFAVRLVLEAQRRVGFKPLIRSYLGRPLALVERQKLAGSVNAFPAALTLAEYSSMGPALSHITYSTARSCLMHDLLSDRATRFRAAGLPVDFHEVSFDDEIRWIETCDSLVFASANELKKVSAQVPRARSVWLRPDAPDYTTGAAAGPVRIVFIGTTHGGNALSLDHFIDHIWPIIHARRPGLTFEIAGSIGKGLSPERASAPGVRVLGRVENLADIGGQGTIGVAPTMLATGVSIKVAEYLLLGMTCVAYPLALEGFGDVLDDLVTCVQTPDAFAQAVLELADRDDLRQAKASQIAAQARSRLSNTEVIDLLSETPLPLATAWKPAK